MQGRQDDFEAVPATTGSAPDPDEHLLCILELLLGRGAEGGAEKDDDGALWQGDVPDRSGALAAPPVE